MQMKTEQNKTIKIDKDNQGIRLDKFLTEKWPDISRSQIKKMILASDVLINNKKATVHQFLKANDKILIKKQDRRSKKQVITKLQKTKLKKNSIKIIDQQNDFIIIEKPADLLVHPTGRGEKNTLIDLLIKQFPKLSKIGYDPMRPALVHRLDKNVSGLMIIPASQDSYDYFKSQFKQRKIYKRYTALVYGLIDKNEGKIDFPIGRSKNKKKAYAAHPQKKGKQAFNKDKQAITEFKVIKRLKKYTLLSVEILTGRTHQIRVHLLATGHPVVGDSLYNIKNTKPANINRIFLHASELRFEYKNKKYHYKSDLPDELKIIIEKNR